MAFLDRFRRKQEAKIAKRNYAGVNTGRLFADFVSSERSADSELRPALRMLRNRSRDLSINNEYIRRYFELLKVNVIGEKGAFFQSKATDSIGNLDQTGNQAVENAFKMWGKFGNCTVDGKLSWIDAQKLAVELMAKDGEAFIIKHRSADFTDSFAIEFLEADQVSCLSYSYISSWRL
jgi:capsid protein